MRIGIDVRYLSHGLIGGVHTYIANFVPALLELSVEHDVFLYSDTKRPLELAVVPPHATVRSVPWLNPLSSVYADLSLRNWMARDRLDVVHFPANYGFGPAHVPSVVTVHDAINMLPLHEIVRGHHKDLRTVALMTYLHFCTQAAVRRAALVLTVSNHAARDIASHAGLSFERVVPIPHAPAPDLRRITDSTRLGTVRDRLHLPMAFVLADALKNPEVLVSAWRQLPATLRCGRQIVFFSRRPDPPTIVNVAVESGYARLLVRVSRADLIALYSMADAFVFPSWMEGFGIPLLEAMSCGAPIIASNRGAIPEVVGDAAILIDAEDAPGLASRLASVLSDPALTTGLRQRGFARASRHSWRRTAAQILDSYTRVVTVG